MSEMKTYTRTELYRVIEKLQEAASGVHSDEASWLMVKTASFWLTEELDRQQKFSSQLNAMAERTSTMARQLGAAGWDGEPVEAVVEATRALSRAAAAQLKSETDDENAQE